MLTKREYCEVIVQQEMDALKIPNRESAHSFIFQSSCLAVALEYLGELDEVEAEYASSRGGIVERYLDFDENGSFRDAYFLSVRDMISLLPETVERTPIGTP